MTAPALPKIPAATYRLQLNRFFTFVDAQRLVPYLSALGITDAYTSSFLNAVPGSLHGYDLIDPTALNPEIGTEKEFQAFAEALQEADMDLLMDLVPNHMGIGKSVNRWWQDVLENGPSARHASFFDIDWKPVKRELADKVLLPILGDQYGTVLENGAITLCHEDGAFFLQYHDHRLPVAPKSAAMILTHRLDTLIQEAGPEDPPVQELQSIVTAIGHLPSCHDRDPERIAERYREKEVIKRRLAALMAESAGVKAFVEENVTLFNGVKGVPESFDLLDALLDQQAYRLASWRVAAEEINYRRFFDVNELAAVRMEDPEVFHEFHRLVFRFLKGGTVTRLRIDHVDGLYHPGEYLRQLQDWVKGELGATQDGDDRPLYLVVEKILNKDEALPESWPVYGTTGYDFLNLLNGLFVNGANERLIEEAYTRFIGRRLVYDDLVYESKKLIMRVAMSSELNVLGHQLNRLSERDRRSRDFTLNSLTNAIHEIIACFPVYRTYLTEDGEVLERDRAYIQRAVALAKRRSQAISGQVFDFVRSLLLKEADERTQRDRQEQLRFVMKFQQTTSQVIAKGIEDTAFYLYNRLVSLNEVGGDPTQFGVSLGTFHKRMHDRQARWPHALSATSTHDTKRSEDARARINVLSELPREWRACLARWGKSNKRHKTEIDGRPAPDRNEEYLLYQTLLGVWPLVPTDDAEYRAFGNRIQAYMAKAIREAKVHTSWVNPDSDYEEAVRHFIGAILDRTRPNPFLDDFLLFQERVARYGLYNSLAQVAVKVSAPGVPDFYQGTELWDFSLVDPDNRRPVNYALRAELLEGLQRTCARHGTDRRELVGELLKSWTDSRIKLYVTMTCLAFRKANPQLFREGEYVPLEAGGPKRDHVVSFARIYADRATVTVVPRLIAGLLPDPQQPPLGAEVWEDTWVTVPSWRPGSPYRNLYTGETLASQTSGDRQTLPLAGIFATFPVALLERID